MYTHNPEASGETTKVCERVKSFNYISLYVIQPRARIIYMHVWKITMHANYVRVLHGLLYISYSVCSN